MADFTDLFHLDMIIVNVDVLSKEEALRFMSNELQKNGYVENGYYDMLIARENEYPTGLATQPFQVAIPHTDPLHVLRPCIAVLKLKTPITFTEMTKIRKVDVRYIFGLILKKNKDQVSLLQKFINLFSDEKKMIGLMNATTPAEILNVLSLHENERK
ncbi:MAG: PTS sugar transporter subunit IIA [Clostridiales Family XIII bacterium]|jgi:PTS system galactitol-specific IIA component|nr:PTS sugar transporter subunit IIA [Clostridiales Family XIII bacterium]